MLFSFALLSTKVTVKTVREAFGDLITPDKAILPSDVRFQIPPLLRTAAVGRAEEIVEAKAFSCKSCRRAFKIKNTYEKHYHDFSKRENQQEGHTLDKVPSPRIIDSYAVRKYVEDDMTNK